MQPSLNPYFCLKTGLVLRSSVNYIKMIKVLMLFFLHPPPPPPGRWFPTRPEGHLQSAAPGMVGERGRDPAGSLGVGGNPPCRRAAARGHGCVGGSDNEPVGRRRRDRQLRRPDDAGRRRRLGVSRGPRGADRLSGTVSRRSRHHVQGPRLADLHY